MTDLLRQTGYKAALTMNDLEDRFAEQSKDLLAIDRIGSLDWQSAIARAWGGPTLSSWNQEFELAQGSRRSYLRRSLESAHKGQGFNRS